MARVSYVRQIGFVALLACALAAAPSAPFVVLPRQRTVPAPWTTSPAGCVADAIAPSAPAEVADFAAAAQELRGLAASAAASAKACPDLARAHALARGLLALCRAGLRPQPAEELAFARLTTPLSAVAQIADADLSDCAAASPVFCVPTNEAPCDPAREWFADASRGDLAAAHVAAVGELSTYALAVVPTAARYVRSLLRAGLALLGGANSSFPPQSATAAPGDAATLSPSWHLFGLPPYGVASVVRSAEIAPLHAFYFSTTYRALEYEARFKADLHLRLRWFAESVFGAAAEALIAAPASAAGAEAPLPLPEFLPASASEASGCVSRVLVIDAFWMKGFASHRVTRPLVTAMSAASCTTLVFGYQGKASEAEPAGAEGDDTRAGFVQAFGVPVWDDSASTSAWRLALARKIAAARFDAVWFASVGMTSFDITLASFPLAPVQSLGVGHPASTGSLHMSHFFAGAVPDVIGPLSSNILAIFGPDSDCRPQLADMEAALASLCAGEAADAGVASSSRVTPRWPILALCDPSPHNKTWVCRLCSRFSLPAGAESIKGGRSHTPGICRSVPSTLPPLEALLRRLEDAQRRYSEQLVLVPGIGMGLTDTVTKAALSVRRPVRTLAAAQLGRLLAAARAIDRASDANIQRVALVRSLVRSPPCGPFDGSGNRGGGVAEDGCEGENEWAAGASPESPLVVGITWSNPKWNERSVHRLLSSVRAAQERNAAQWRRCAAARGLGLASAVRFARTACGRMLAARPAGPALFVQLLVFVPMDGLRAAAFQAVLARAVEAALPPDGEVGGVSLRHIFQAGHMGEYLAALGAADLSLDSQPFSGGNTMHDLLALAVPVVSLAHDGELEAGTDSPLRWRSALGASILTVSGLSGLVALDEAEQELKFARLASNPYLRAAWRQRIAEVVPHEAIQPPHQAGCYAAALRDLSMGGRCLPNKC